jgi:hypothetical protein
MSIRLCLVRHGATDWRVSIAGVDHAGAGWADRLVAVWRDHLSKSHNPRTAP